MARAIFNGEVIAESNKTRRVEGNAYFPPGSLRRSFFQDSPQTTVCGWKGTAQYYDVVVDGQTAAGAAWYYAEPKAAAAEIKGYVAFWRGVVVEDP